MYCAYSRSRPSSSPRSVVLVVAMLVAAFVLGSFSLLRDPPKAPRPSGPDEFPSDASLSFEVDPAASAVVPADGVFGGVAARLRRACAAAGAKTPSVEVDDVRPRSRFRYRVIALCGGS